MWNNWLNSLLPGYYKEREGLATATESPICTFSLGMENML